MPLRDHFQAPLFPQRDWQSFHARFTVSIADQLNRMLPRRFLAEVQTHLGSRVEADVAEFEQLDEREWEAVVTNGPGGGVAVAAWAPPVATLTMPAVFPDAFEVNVHDERDGMRLVAVIELVSPGNKDRPESRLAFVAKSVAYLQRGIGVLVIDLVTERQFNLHNEMLSLLNLDSTFGMPGDPHLYAVSYGPMQRGDASVIDVWPAAMSVGSALPLLPLWLRRFRAVPLDLEAIYEDTCRRARL